MKRDQQMLKVECSACSGTGLYKGFAEPDGHAVVCHKCDGKGYQMAKEFGGRRTKKGIKYVLVDGGTWFSRSGPATKQPKITIAEFRERYPE